MTRIVHLVPRRPDAGHRDAVWAWIEAKWEREFPDLERFIGGHYDGPWNRSVALNDAARLAGDWDVALISDADSFCSREQVVNAINTTVRTGLYTLAFERFCYLKPAGSTKIMEGFNGSWEPLIEWTLREGCSSMLTVPRSAWDAVGGFDEGFVGWGEEDVAFSIACQTMAPRRYTGAQGQTVEQLRRGFHRIPGDCWHLWHPISETNNPNLPGYKANLARRGRYVDAAHNPAAMAELLAELHAETGRVPA